MAELLVVRFGPLRFGYEDPDEIGFHIDTEGIDGWDDGVDIRREDIPIQNGHGNVETPSFLAQRVVVVPGYCLAESDGALDNAQRRLLGQMGRPAQQFSVLTESGTENASGSIASKPRWKKWGGSAYAEYEASFWFAKPWKYGEPRTFDSVAGVVKAWHRGNQNAIPTFEVTGSAAGYTLNGPDSKQFTVDHPVVAGHNHIINGLTGRLTIDGAPAGGVTRRDLWPIVNDDTTTQSITPVSGALTFKVHVKDTSA
ncbi:hypothetical protein BH09ACT9_BH09ACT9_00750 [soil metagenome]